jgi:acyl-coenzyme A synthetase/AMP-(fatty) acid ligase
MAVLTQKVAKWWLPDDILFVSELPHTATGKLNKLKLRELYQRPQAADVAASSFGAESPATAWTQLRALARSGEAHLQTAHRASRRFQASTELLGRGAARWLEEHRWAASLARCISTLG